MRFDCHVRSKHVSPLHAMTKCFSNFPYHQTCCTRQRYDFISKAKWPEGGKIRQDVGSRDGCLKYLRVHYCVLLVLETLVCNPRAHKGANRKTRSDTTYTVLFKKKLTVQEKRNTIGLVFAALHGTFNYGLETSVGHGQEFLKFQRIQVGQEGSTQHLTELRTA